jgi:uncharacterized protein YbjT (DUF2867 family)
MACAFVGGATGYTGREVVRKLVARGVRTVAHVRPDSPQARNGLDELRREWAAEGAEVDATAWDEAELSRTMQRIRPDIVFALLGTTRDRVKKAPTEAAARARTYEAVDYALTAMLLRAAVTLGPRGAKFVYLSALGAESSSGEYYAARKKAERDVRASGLPYVIARPSFITGPDRPESRPVERTAAKVADTMLSWMSLLGGKAGKGLEARFGSMTAAELAEALVALALSAEERETVAEPERLREVLAAASGRGA